MEHGIVRMRFPGLELAGFCIKAKFKRRPLFG